MSILNKATVNLRLRTTPTLKNRLNGHYGQNRLNRHQRNHVQIVHSVHTVHKVHFVEKKFLR